MTSETGHSMPYCALLEAFRIARRARLRALVGAVTLDAFLPRTPLPAIDASPAASARFLFILVPLPAHLADLRAGTAGLALGLGFGDQSVESVGLV